MPFKNKEESRQYMREYRKKMTDEQMTHALEKIEQRKKEIQAWFCEFKTTLCCNRCDENHPACLEFHHIDPNSKEFNVYEAVWFRGHSKEKILAEIDKCEVLCANCHKKHHFNLKQQSA